MASAAPLVRDHLVWKKVTVDGRPATYGEAGEGIPLVFLHGWGLAHHSYKRALKRLVHLGCKVYAPALPGFGGTPDLHGTQFSFPGFAGWLDRFMEAVEIEEPAIVVGHSFGGAVGIQLAHDHPDRVRTLVLVNSVGGSAWTSSPSKVKALAERPLWDWGIHFPGDVMPLPHVARVLPVVLEDAVSNALRNPRGLWKAANLVRKADMTVVLEELKRRRLPVVVLWGTGDKIIPKASFDALCAAIGSRGEVVAGNHSWLLADPDAFGEVMTNVVDVARIAREMEDGEPRRSAVRRLIRRQARREKDPADRAADSLEPAGPGATAAG